MSSEDPKLPPDPRIHLGAAYYPEHWPEERWPEDIRLMREVGLSVVRMAEFAWSTLEPDEGDFQFGWLDKVIQSLSEAGILTVLGTPSAAPPAWLVQKYPDLLTVEEDGRRVQFGNRCHYCVNSPEFHNAVRRIVSAMGEHFGPNPAVIGWQLDNEYSQVCYCDRCRKLFQDFLSERYQTLANLNARWSTAYWSQTYSAWEQIPIPIGPHNPGLMLEFKRFITHSYRKFQRLQLDNLRPYLKPGVWVSHNFMGWYDGFDHYSMAEELDLASWDWYVGTGQHDYTVSGAMHDLIRGLKQKNFWIMETQPGNVNWSPINNALNEGEARAMAWHAVGHGADAILYWQWRSALGGQEQYHGTLVDQSGQPRPFYTEAQNLGKEFSVVSGLLAGTKPAARVAMLYSYNSRWSIQWQPHHRDFNYVEHFLNYYRCLIRHNIPVDIISADASLENYDLVIAPALLLINEEQAARLKEYTKRGGYLVLTIRSGMKDDYNALLPSRQPGLLTEMTGVEVEDYYALRDPVPVVGNWFTGLSRQWAERLKIIDGKQPSVAARFGPANGWLDKQVAITVNSYGHGFVYYVGAYLDEETQQVFLDHVIRTARIRSILQTPPGVEVCKRVGTDRKDVYIVINHEDIEKEMILPTPVYEYLRDQQIADKLVLPPYDVAVLTREE